MLPWTVDCKEILGKDSKAAKESRKIIFDAEWLKSPQHYVRFRSVLPMQLQLVFPNGKQF